MNHLNKLLPKLVSFVILISLSLTPVLNLQAEEVSIETIPTPEETVIQSEAINNLVTLNQAEYGKFPTLIFTLFLISQ